MPNGGTPYTLDMAIKLAICVGPLKDVEERSYNVLKDFLAHKFQVAMMRHPESEETLKALFEEITKREK